MKRFAMLTCAALGLTLTQGTARAGWTLFGSLKCQNCEEKRLNKFWKDYYKAVDKFYCSMHKLDWVAYYKNHGYQINADCGSPGCPPRINYAPVVVNPPSMGWGGAGCAPGGCGPAGCGPAGGMPHAGAAMMPGPAGMAAMPGYPTAGMAAMPGYPTAGMAAPPGYPAYSGYPGYPGPQAGMPYYPAQGMGGVPAMPVGNGMPGGR